MALLEPYTKITDPPKNVKEAIDWVLRVTKKDSIQSGINYKNFCTSLTTVLGNGATFAEDDIKSLGEALCKLMGWQTNVNIFTSTANFNGNGIASQEYKSAYKAEDMNDNNANWSTACRDAKKANESKGAKCCVDASGQNGCSKCDTQKKNSEYKECDAEGCCLRCPKQICARMFCLIVPVLHSVLKFLQKRITSGEWNGNINTGSISTFLTACGFDVNKLNNQKTGEEIKNQLSEIVNKLKGIKDKMGKALEAFPNGGYFMKPNASQTEPNGNPATPTTICDMLLWLQFLPYCCKYKEVLSKVNNLLNEQTTNSNGFNTKLGELISKLPMIFLIVEGAGSTTASSNNGNSLFQKIGELTKCQHIFKSEYYADPDKAAKILLSVLPIIHWSFGKLNEKCTGEGSNTIAQHSDTKNFLESLGWKENSIPATGPKIGGTMQCTEFKKYLEENLIGNPGKLKAVKDDLVEAWKNNIVHGSRISAGRSQGQYEPQTIREVLLSLQCLPASGVFIELRKRIKDVHNEQFTEYMESFSSMIFELPHMYYSLEGGFNGLLTDLFNYQGIDSSSNAFSYGNGNDTCLKLFSAVVAILYMAFRYLQQRCHGNGDWKDLHLNGKGIKSPAGVDNGDLNKCLDLMGFDKVKLADDKMQGSTFHSTVLEKIFGDLTKPKGVDKLNKLYQLALKHFQEVPANGNHNPKTIRQMMLWLIGLPMTKQYNTLTDSNGKLNDTAMNKVLVSASNVNADHLKEQFLSSASGLAVTMIVIEGGTKSVLDFLKGGFKDDNNSFSYGKTDDNGAASFDLLKDYSYKVHCQLRFLHYMTRESSGNGGWNECKYGNGTKGQGGKCQGCGSKTTCLRLFLEGGEILVNPNPSADTDGNQYYGLVTTGSGEAMKNVGMGFNDKLNGTTFGTGNDIKLSISHICHTEMAKPLTLIMEYLVTIEQREPTTLGDCFDLFRQFTCTGKNLWNHRSMNSKSKQETIEESLTKELAILGVTDKKVDVYVEELKTAIISVYPENHNGNHSQPTYDIFSLGCNETQQHSETCAPYIRPIGHSLWSSYAPKIDDSNTDENKFHTLQWVYDMCYKLLRGLQQLKGAFAKCGCCSTDTCGRSMVECKKALPMLYKHGLTFRSTNDLISNNKKCKDFMDQLENIINVKNPIFRVCEIIIGVIYNVLLIKAKGCVSSKARMLDRTLFNGRDGYKEEWETAFESYVNEAIKKSKEKLECTYLCKLFGITDCKTHNSEPLATPSVPPSVSSEKVTNLEAVIPRYTPPHVDPYNYRTYQKGLEKDYSAYTFKDAINFHIDRSQCITPTPVALRSVIDWLLRVTVGEVNKDNNKIKGLSQALKTVFNTYAEVARVEDHVISLVSGLRKFVGYEEMSNEVFRDLEEEKKNIKEKIEKRIEGINAFLTDKDGFAIEMGRALLKGKYSRSGNSENISFIQTIDELNKQLTVIHTKCNDLKCTKFQEKHPLGQPSSNCPNTQGLKQLHDFFHALKGFAAKWENIGKDNGQDILQVQKKAAVTEVVKQIKKNQSNNEYFTKLQEALKQLGTCADKVSTLDNESRDLANSEKYKEKIQAVIEHLQNKVLSCLRDSSDTNGNGKSDPDFAVKACDSLIKYTKSYIVTEITKKIKEGVERKYTELSQQHSGQCKAHSGSNHKQFRYMCIEIFLNSVTKTINDKLNLYQQHLDDLKQLCQWLYRMGQLYHAGLHGFIKSLVKHLQHIIDVIKWIEGIEKMVTKLKEIGQEDGVTQTINGFNEIQHCCTKHNNLYNSSSFTTRDDFFTALNCRTNNLLLSYVLENADVSLQIHDDPSQKRRQSLTELHLLALDRYTLQVWYDDKAQIKDWITFKSGIVKHSDLDAMKTALNDLTGVDYNPNDKGKIPVQHPQKRNRIHDFHAICVIQKFSYEAPITKLESSLAKLNGIQKQLQEVKHKCDNPIGISNMNEVQEVKDFCQSVTQFLKEPCGVFQFATFVHTILGPNMFSVMLASMEHLKDKAQMNGRSTAEIESTTFYKSIEALLEGPQNTIEKGRSNQYRLEAICKKLQAFISNLKKEYIFSYPVVSSAPTVGVSQVPITDPPAMIPTCYTTHKDYSICNSCYPYLAKIFIGSMPNLYRHCRMLYEMCKQDGTVEATWNNDRFVFKRNGVHSSKDGYLSLGGYMSRNGWRVYNEKDKNNTDKYDLERTKTGENVCILLETIIDDKEPGALVAKEVAASAMTTDLLKPLDKLFKNVMQHFWKKRDEKKAEKEEKLREKYDRGKQYEKSGIPFSPPPPVLPSTVRELLFWLHEMDTKSDFYNKVSDHIMELCQQNNIGIKHDAILHVLKLSITQCLEVLATIEDPGQQHPTYLYDLYSEEHYYDYTIVNIPVFFYTFVEKLMGAFLQLNFVCVQCQFTVLEGGWSSCRFYSSDIVFSRGSKELHCTCTGLESSCPRPLYSLLFTDPKNKLRIPGDTRDRKPYMSKGTMPCGFKLSNDKNARELPSAGGSVLVEPLRKLVGGHIKGRHNGSTTNTLNTVIYLRDLLRYTLCLAVRPPWSMSENMAFFYRVTEAWKQKGHVAQRNGQLRDAIHEQISLFPGTFDGSQLTSAVERFAGWEDKKEHATSAPELNGKHHYDLRTLMGCQENTAPVTGTVQCSPFMFPLALDVYTHYDHKNSRAYLSWILNFAFGIYGQLKALEEMIKEKECVVKNASSSNSSQCPSLPMCPGVLTALYQSGSSFMDQGQLAKIEKPTKEGKTCQALHSVLQGLFNCNTNSSPKYCTSLHNLIVQCEAFLWSIRLPFSLVQLSLWSVAILFISYVFVVPLDHFKIKSNLFNRLKYTMHPSLLVSDGQRRLSEVAYFAL